MCLKSPPPIYISSLYNTLCQCTLQSLLWRSYFSLAWVQHLCSSANRCLLSKASLCCILFYHEDIPKFLLLNSASSLSKWSTEQFSLNRNLLWQTFVHHYLTTSRTASQGRVESVHYLNWHHSLIFYKLCFFLRSLLRVAMNKSYENIYSLWGF